MDLIDERNWTQAHLASRLGISKKHLKNIIKAKVALTNEMAFRLSAVLGSSVEFWMNREAQYRQQLARINSVDRYRDNS